MAIMSRQRRGWIWCACESLLSMPFRVRRSFQPFACLGNLSRRGSYAVDFPLVRHENFRHAHHRRPVDADAQRTSRGCEHAKRTTEPSGMWRRLWTLLGAISTALPEAFLAFRRYERSRSMTVPHDMAIRDALAVGPERDCGAIARLSPCAPPPKVTAMRRSKGHRHVDPPARRQGIAPRCPAKAG